MAVPQHAISRSHPVQPSFPVRRPGFARAHGSGSGNSTVGALYKLHPREIWRYLRTQPASFWFINLYLFFEYVRPQQIYQALLGPPWSQIIILLTVGAFVMEGKPIRFRTSADYMLAAFSVVVLLSCVLAVSPALAFDKLPDYLVWVLVIVLISNIVTTEKQFVVFMFGYMLWNFKMSQTAARGWAMDGFAFRDWGASGAPGWFSNSGEFGIQMAMIVPLTIYFILGLRKHWGKKTLLLHQTMVVTGLMSVMASSSRGAQLAVGVAVVVMVLKAHHRTRGLLGFSAFALFVYLILPEEQRERFESVGDDKTSVARKIYWAFGREVINQYPLFGIGLNNWADYYEKFHGYRSLPHNILIEAGAELGYIGLITFLVLAITTFVVNWQTRRLVKPLGEEGKFLFFMAHGLDAALVAFLVSGQFVTVLFFPFFWINLAMTIALHNAARDKAGTLSAGGRRLSTGARRIPRRSPLVGPPVAPSV
jgi:putative inorganic carbon (HCO3(-)) transporter